MPGSAVGEIDVMFLKEKEQKGLRRLKWLRRFFRWPTKEYDSWWRSKLTLFRGFCILVGRDEATLNTSVSPQLCPYHLRWPLIIEVGDVSRRHAVVMPDRNSAHYQLTDLGSANGTFLCQTTSRLEKGGYTVTGFGIDDQQPLYLIRGQRLAAGAPVAWQSRQYCFLGESTLLRVNLFGTPQKRDEAMTGTRIYRKGDSFISEIIPR